MPTLHLVDDQPTLLIHQVQRAGKRLPQRERRGTLRSRRDGRLVPSFRGRDGVVHRIERDVSFLFRCRGKERSKRVSQREGKNRRLCWAFCLSLSLSRMKAQL